MPARTEESDLKRQRGAEIANHVVILDGACGLELKRRKSEGQAIAYNLQLFSTAALIETPDAVRKLHADYAAAGAQVLTTATFAVTRQYLDKAGQGHRVGELARLAVRLTREAAAAATRSGQGPIRVAGSVPPLAECYRADLLKSREEMNQAYSELTAAMADAPGVDLWLCETMSSLREARAAVAACRAANAAIPLWVSFVLRHAPRDGRVEIMDGSALADAVTFSRDSGAEALLFNCSTPRLIGEALSRLAGAPAEGLLLGGYGNFWEEHKAGWTIESQETESGKGDVKADGLRVHEISVEDYVESARNWVASGARIVGGCCGIGPEHIRAVAAAFKS